MISHTLSLILNPFLLQSPCHCLLTSCIMATDSPNLASSPLHASSSSRITSSTPHNSKGNRSSIQYCQSLPHSSSLLAYPIHRCHSPSNSPPHCRRSPVPLPFPLAPPFLFAAGPPLSPAARPPMHHCIVGACSPIPLRPWCNLMKAHPSHQRSITEIF